MLQKGLQKSLAHSCVHSRRDGGFNNNLSDDDGKGHEPEMSANRK